MTEADKTTQMVEKFWKEHEPYVRKLCEFKLRSTPDRIDDCIQEVFLALSVALHNRITIKSPKAWLTKVAINKINDIYKEVRIKNDRLVSLTDELAATIPDSKTVDFDDSPLSEEDLLSAKNSFLKTLSPEEKELFRDRFVLKEKTKTIAAKHGTTESNIRKKIFKLRNKAKEYTKAYVKNNQNKQS